MSGEFGSLMAPDAQTALKWHDAVLAPALAAIDPYHLHGIWLSARMGPVRAKWLSAVTHMIPDRSVQRLSPSMHDGDLFGDLDIAATLAEGRKVRTSGIAAQAAHLWLMPMAEQVTTSLAAKLAYALENNESALLIALDEALQEEDPCPNGLTSRLALHVSLEGLRLIDCLDPVISAGDIDQARSVLASVSYSDDVLKRITALAVQLGIRDFHAPLAALYTARASAALHGHDLIEQEDIEAALRLVLAPRAKQWPQAEVLDDGETDPPNPDFDQEPPEQDGDSNAKLTVSEDVVLEALQASLPPDALKRLANGARRTRGRQAASGSGRRKRNRSRGRPMPSRPGPLRDGAMLHILDTLKAAAPWQVVRSRQLGEIDPDKKRLHIWPADFRIRQFEDRSERVLIFLVDASGSAAMSRLAETKGAIELLLAEAYARRDHVALIAFRGEVAEVLLPPTRSLVQTKRRLASLPGGGGTPLASGLEAGFHLAQAAQAKGMLPALIVLTDGQGNIDLQRQPGRKRANDDAAHLARLLSQQGWPALVVDISARPRPASQDLATLMSADYLPLPHANAERLSAAVSTSLQSAS